MQKRRVVKLPLRYRTREDGAVMSKGKQAVEQNDEADACVFCRNADVMAQPATRKHLDLLLSLNFVKGEEKRETSVNEWIEDKRVCAFCAYTVRLCLDMQSQQAAAVSDVDKCCMCLRCQTQAQPADCDATTETLDLIMSRQSTRRLSEYMRYAANKIMLTDRARLCLRCNYALEMYDKVKRYVYDNIFVAGVHRRKRLHDPGLPATEFAKEHGLVLPHSVLDDAKMAKCSCKVVAHVEKRTRVSFPVIRLKKRALPVRLQGEEYRKYIGCPSVVEVVQMDVDVADVVEVVASEVTVEVTPSDISDSDIAPEAAMVVECDAMETTVEEELQEEPSTEPEAQEEPSTEPEAQEEPSTELEAQEEAPTELEAEPEPAPAPLAVEEVEVEDSAVEAPEVAATVDEAEEAPAEPAAVAAEEEVKENGAEEVESAEDCQEIEPQEEVVVVHAEEEHNGTNGDVDADAAAAAAEEEEEVLLVEDEDDAKKIVTTNFSVDKIIEPLTASVEAQMESLFSVGSPQEVAAPKPNAVDDVQPATTITV